MIRAELLYFDGCPNWHTAWARLGESLVDLDLDATVRLRNIRNLPEDARSGFAGSPTIRINGRDLEDYDGPPRMACRRYLDNEGKGWPSTELLRRRLASADKASRPEDP